MLKRGVKECLYSYSKRVITRRTLSSQVEPEGDPEHTNATNKEEIEKEIPNHILESLKQPDFFHVADIVHIDELFEAKVHLGHREGTLDAQMKPYIFGSRLGHLIIDLDQTAYDLKLALNFTAHIAFRGGIILFVCRSNQHQLLVEKTAKDCGEYSHTRLWKQGMFTDSNRHYGQLIRLPDLLVVLNTHNDVLAQHEAINEAAKLLIPSIGIVDTNSDPRLLTYPVPGNDDSFSAISLYCKLFGEAISRGKEMRKKLLLPS